MANEKFYVTQEGYNELVKELDNLVHNVRAQVIVELQEARAQGDLSENADYDAARDHQAQVEGRIRELEALIKKSEIISEEDAVGQAEKVRIGSVVTFKDLSDDTVMTYSIVGTIEANPFEGKISNDSPVARRLMDKKAGDIVLIDNVAEPYKIEILEIK